MIHDLENYTNTKMKNWKNFNNEDYIPKILSESNPDINNKWFHYSIYNNTLRLPTNVKYLPVFSFTGSIN